MSNPNVEGLRNLTEVTVSVLDRSRNRTEFYLNLKPMFFPLLLSY